MNYLNIGNQLEMRQHMFQDRLNIWEELFPLPERRVGKNNRQLTAEDVDYDYDIDVDN